MSEETIKPREQKPVQNQTDSSLLSRIRANPRPAVIWLLTATLLLLPELGAVVHTVADGISMLAALTPIDQEVARVLQVADAFPSVLSRETIPNQGYYDGDRWVNTFLGLEPMYAWLIRVILIVVYSLLWVLCARFGYSVYRRHYRRADWSPTDDYLERFRFNRWGQFGLVLVFLFLVMVVFSPALGPTTVDQNIKHPYSYEINSYDESTDSIKTISIGEANRNSRSQGTSDTNIGIMNYDDYGRFHPFGTMPLGQDLFTFIVAGARISLFIGIVSVVISGLIGGGLVAITSYYKGVAESITVLLVDSLMSIPRLVLLILLSVLFANTAIGSMYNGALLIALILSFTQWPALWRALRGPTLQIVETGWVDAAHSFGQTPQKIMQKHMLPYIVGYLSVYLSMYLGGVIIVVSGLSFLGVGITAPTPEWGRAVAVGQEYITTASWHISFIPGVLITIIVIGFNALGDGIRDAMDPQSTGAEGESEAATRGGGA